MQLSETPPREQQSYSLAEGLINCDFFVRNEEVVLQQQQATLLFFDYFIEVEALHVCSLPSQPS